MRSLNKILISLLLVFSLLFNIIACVPSSDGNNVEQTREDFYIKGDAAITLKVGERISLGVIKPEGVYDAVKWTSSSSCATVSNGVVTAKSEGTAVIKAILGDYVDRVTVTIVANDENNENNNGDNNNVNNGGGNNDVIDDPYKDFGSEYPCITVAEALEIAEGYISSESVETYYIVAEITDIENLSKGRMTISDDTGSIYVYNCTDIDGAKLSTLGLEVGDVILIGAKLYNYKGSKLEVNSGFVIDFYNPNDLLYPDENDPYANVDPRDFYKNYTPAKNYEDAYYRTKHNLMSGTIAEQDQAPTISKYQPTKNGKLVRNNSYLFSDDGNTYYVVDAYGEVVMEIYRGGAYIMLEEVAAYVFAFGQPPANQSSSKDTTPYESEWGEYLRVNHTVFSGDTYKYPYEPVLPRISGCGGDLTYYEMDIGTTGTDCDPSYTAELYNNGYYIVRGAARIVYSCKDRNGNNIIDLDERYVFYTYNHYNDFQEYLNYLGGWGRIFGNITGGGTISSKYDYNPTDYVEVVRASLKSVTSLSVIYYYVPKEELAA